MGLLSFAAGAMNFLRPYAAEAIKYVLPQVASWGAGKLGSIIGGQQLGPTVSQWVGEDTFKNTMKKFGKTLDDSIVNSNITFTEGITPGDAYYKGMKTYINHMNNPGTARPIGHVQLDQTTPGGMQSLRKQQMEKNNTSMQQSTIEKGPISQTVEQTKNYTSTF